MAVPAGLMSFNGNTEPDAISAALVWLQGALLGSVATTAAVIAVASIGFLMLAGRIDIRRAIQVVFGCFILFGASTIAAGINAMVFGSTPEVPPQSTPAPLPPPGYPTPPSQPYDPYAGAAVPPQ